MGVYISGLEMPQSGRITLQIDSNGGVYVVNKFSITSEKYEKSMITIGIKPHGRLIDADKFKADHSMKNDCAECEKKLQGSSRSCEYDRIYSKMDFCEWIDNAVTVIEAED